MEDRIKSAREVLGHFLKERRISLGLSVYKVAKESGIQIGQVHIVESGEKAYTIDTLLKLSTPLNLYIFFGEKEGKKDGHLDADHMIT